MAPVRSKRETVQNINVFQQIIEFFTSIPEMIMSSILPQAAPSAPAVSGQANAVGPTFNFYDTIIDSGEALVEFGEGLGSQLQDLFTGRTS